MARLDLDEDSLIALAVPALLLKVSDVVELASLADACP
jgi:hypothetical protein